VVVEEVDGGLSGDARRKGSDGREDCSFRHVGGRDGVCLYGLLFRLLFYSLDSSSRITLWRLVFM
jgi:hypothetical protein